MKLKKVEEYDVDLSTKEGTEEFMRCLFDTVAETSKLKTIAERASAYGVFKQVMSNLLTTYGNEIIKNYNKKLLRYAKNEGDEVKEIITIALKNVK